MVDDRNPSDLFSQRAPRSPAPGSPAPGFQARGQPAETREVFTVSELTGRIKADLENNFQGIWVAGEISNLSRPNSGHVYLTLKDEKSQLAAVIWKSTIQRIKFELRDGLAVLVHGDITVYPPRGSYQMIASRILPQGVGALQLAFMQLKEKLEKEGLFDKAHKKPLPMVPHTIGIVTSSTGAAIRDILKQIGRRFPAVHVLLYPARVQGDGAAEDIVDGIRALNQHGGVDVMIVGRGGGSIEDLWAFNEEIVARAIYASRVPVISAVGHEVDVTISDLVADARALTPTAAGEMVVPDRKELLLDLQHHQERLRNALVHKVNVSRAELQRVAQATVFRKPLQTLALHQQHLDEHLADLRRMSGQWLALLRQRLGSNAARLEGLSPLKVLARGYSLTLKSDGSVLRRATDVAPGAIIKTVLSQGAFTATVREVAADVPPKLRTEGG